MSANPIDELLADYDAGKLNAQSFVQGVRANLAERDAEVEELRAEVTDVRASAVDIEKEAREAWKQATHWRRKASRAERLAESLRDLLALPIAEEELRRLDKGIGTATRSAAWLRARAAAQENDGA